MKKTTIQLPNGMIIGGSSLTLIAGPCAVESEDQILKTAQFLKNQGIRILRAGAYKPRSSPHTFQGLGEEGLKILSKARKETGLMIITEAMDPRDVPLVEEYADIIQVGSRNVQNFPLLKELGQAHKPVLLKRGFATTIKEWLLSAEYITHGGNPNVILCERGIRTFETATRNSLDLNAIPVLREKSPLPVLVDPSHGTGVARYVPPMSLAALAAGADGLMVEVHPNPAQALSDGEQSLDFTQFEALMALIKPLAQHLGRAL